MKSIIIFIVYFILFVSFKMSQAQRIYATNNFLWLVCNIDKKITPKVGIHLEYQERRSDLGHSNQQHLFRTGINYHLLPNAFVTLGYAAVETVPYGDFPVKSKFLEHRIYEQFQYSTNLENIEAVSRFRLEQRFLYLPVLQSDSTYKQSSTSTFTERFRYFQRFSLPLYGRKIVDKSFFLTFYNELFINIGKKVQMNLFDQNRAFIGLGYKIPKLGRLECGYMNQLLFKSDGIKVENNRTFLVSLNTNLDLKKK